MNKLTSPNTIKYIMDKYGFKFSKGLGQNFIIDENVIESIMNKSNISKDDFILEIGPGIGVMTKELAQRAKKVVAIEIDSFLIPVLQETLQGNDNVKVINEDVLKSDLNRIIDEEFGGKKPKVIANLPYYVTTPIIMRFLEEDIKVKEIIVMVQKEVAERMISKSNCKIYGALSVAVQYYSKPSVITYVPRTVFMPSPNVDSVVIKMDILEEPPVKVLNKKTFFNTIKAAFGMRRKTLLNSISGGLGIEKNKVKFIFDRVGIDPKRRGETLSIDEFALLSNEIETQK